MADNLLGQIRSQHPEYNDLSDQQLADGVYKKFYSDMPRDQFNAKIGISQQNSGVLPKSVTDALTSDQFASGAGKIVADNSALPKSVTDTLTSDKFASGAAKLVADNTVGVDPGFINRDLQRRVARSEGTSVPPLSANAGFGSKAADAIQNVLNYPEGISNLFAHGATLGTSDEASAFGATLDDLVRGNMNGQSFGDQFIANDKQQNKVLEDFKSKNPITGNIAEMAGYVTSPLGNVGNNFISRGGNIASRALRAAGVGGALGALSGASNSDGGISDRAKSAIFGAGTGAAAAGVLSPAFEVGGKLVSTTYDTIRNQINAARDPEGQAQRLLANALLRDNTTVADALQNLQASPDLGIVNAAGPNTAALGRAATVAPGDARTAAADFFENQSAGMADRGADAVRPLARNGYYGTLQQLDTARRTAAQPLYDAAYQLPAVDQWSPQIANLMERPSMRAAFSKAATIAAEEGRNPLELGLTFNAAGDPAFVQGARNGQIPSTQTMDYVKRGLDDVLEQFRDPVSGRLNLDTWGRAAQNTRAQYVNLLRNANPTYAQALDAWGGPSHSIDMMNFGRDLWKSAGNPADRIARFQSLTPADQEMVRTGLMKEAINKVGNLGDNSSVYNALFGNANKRAIFEQVFPSQQAFDAFATAMRRERDILRTQRTVMGGSPTARIDAENADAIQQLGNNFSMIKQLLTGHPIQAIGTAVTKSGNLQRGMSEPVANELGRLLFNADGSVNTQALQALQGTQAQPGILQILRNQQLNPNAPTRIGQGLLNASRSIGGPAGQLGSYLATP